MHLQPVFQVEEQGAGGKEQRGEKTDIGGQSLPAVSLAGSEIRRQKRNTIFRKSGRGASGGRPV